MTKKFFSVAALAVALAACSGDAGEDTGEPRALELTPGAWAANADQASYADEDGNLLATFRCDPEAAEIVLEMEGGFAEGARPAMLMRAGDFMHGVDPVEVRSGANGPVRIAPMPITGPISATIIEFPAPLTIEADGAEPLMVETDAVLQDYFAQCATAAGGEAPADEAQ
ncbi:hypothetical protein [Parasphingopyxis sp.]|uniref:hypothetical protein n=1 Tax=Parasphingopyxis sp. TaxID=1920299 RepID=UPI002621B5A9|nr:hypothetical protein [Parasphingopyxis sp.]